VPLKAREILLEEGVSVGPTTNALLQCTIGTIKHEEKTTASVVMRFEKVEVYWSIINRILEGPLLPSGCDLFAIIIRFFNKTTIQSTSASLHKGAGHPSLTILVNTISRRSQSN